MFFPISQKKADLKMKSYRVELREDRAVSSIAMQGLLTGMVFSVMLEVMESEIQQTSSQSPSRKQTNKSFLVAGVLFLILLSGMVGVFIGVRKRENTMNQLLLQPNHAATQLSPTSVPTTMLTGDTVDYARDSQQVYLRYKGDVTVSDNLRYKSIPPNLVWHPIVQAPATDSQNHRLVFSLHTVDNLVYGFMFVMEWDATHYDLYIHKKDGTTEKLAAFDITDKSNNGYNVPKINQISQDGNYVALNMYGCWYCELGQPSVLLMNIMTKKTDRIDQVSYFHWENNGVYEYKEYVTKSCPSPSPGQVNFTNKCPVDPQKLPLKTGQFE